MRWISLFVVSCLLAGSVGLVSISHGNSTWRVLDLPSGGITESIFEEPEDPKTGGPLLPVMDPFGMVLGGDAFHLCFSAYAFSDPTTFELIREEVSRVVNQLSSETYFSLGAYHCYSVVWQPEAQLATPDAKECAQSWLDGMNTMGIQHAAEAAVATIERANALDVAGQRIIMLANGVPNDACPTVAAIAGANTNDLPIDVIYVGGGTSGANFWQQVATQYGGQFLNVE